jgi:hypothetical protein
VQQKKCCGRRNKTKLGKELGKQDRKVNNRRGERKIIEREAMGTIRKEWVCKEEGRRTKKEEAMKKEERK